MIHLWQAEQTGVDYSEARGDVAVVGAIAGAVAEAGVGVGGVAAACRVVATGADTGSASGQITGGGYPVASGDEDKCVGSSGEGPHAAHVAQMTPEAVEAPPGRRPRDDMGGNLSLENVVKLAHSVTPAQTHLAPHHATTTTRQLSLA